MQEKIGAALLPRLSFLIANRTTIYTYLFTQHTCRREGNVNLFKNCDEQVNFKITNRNIATASFVQIHLTYCAVPCVMNSNVSQLESFYSVTQLCQCQLKES